MQAAYWDGEIARWRPLGLASAEEARILVQPLGAAGGDRILDASCPSAHPRVIRNQLLPWQAEALLRALGWDILDQFPSFAPSVAGVANPYTPEMAARLADRLLRQTVASSWWFVTAKPANT